MSICRAYGTHTHVHIITKHRPKCTFTTRARPSALTHEHTHIHTHTHTHSFTCVCTYVRNTLFNSILFSSVLIVYAPRKIKQDIINKYKSLKR